MMRSALVLSLFLGTLTAFAPAQAVPSATSRTLSLTAGGMYSGFNPHDAGQNNYPSESKMMQGIGTYVDMHFSHWVQLEAEGRWMRWGGYGGEHQDNYLIGPRIPIHQFGENTQVYGKVLIGLGRMTFPNGYGYGSFTDLAFGGAVDHQLTPKISVKADFEYQNWPVWLNNSSLSPYGFSFGVGYKVF